MRGLIRRIKKKNIRKQINRFLSKGSTTGRNQRLRSMGVIVDEESHSDLELFYTLGKRLGIHRKDIRLLGYVAEVGKVPTMRSNVVHNSDFNWKGELQQDEAETFLERPFDLLVSFYQGDNPYLDLMTLMSAAPFKVGLAGCDPRLFDMTVAVPLKSGKVFVNEVVKYMDIMGKSGPQLQGNYIKV